MNNEESKITANDLNLVMTCGACPEQYDVLYQDKRIGYLRLRHGYFTVEYPDVGGDLIYSAEPKGDGIFENDERDFYLKKAKKAIVKAYNRSL